MLKSSSFLFPSLLFLFCKKINKLEAKKEKEELIIAHSCSCSSSRCCCCCCYIFTSIVVVAKATFAHNERTFAPEWRQRRLGHFVVLANRVFSSVGNKVVIGKCGFQAFSNLHDFGIDDRRRGVDLQVRNAAAEYVVAFLHCQTVLFSRRVDRFQNFFALYVLCVCVCVCVCVVCVCVCV